MDSDIKKLCVECKKPIPSSRRQPAKFCSKECAAAYRKRYQKEYIARRYATEEEYRKRRVQYALKANKAYKKKVRANLIMFYAKELHNLFEKGATVEEIAVYVKQNFNIKHDD